MRADPLLGTAASFAVFGASAVTNVGGTALYGNLGSATAVTGFPVGGVTGGAIYVGDQVEAQALGDAQAAYTTLAGITMTQDLTGQDLGGMILTPGKYTFSSTAALTGQLDLNFENLNNQTIVIETGTTLTTASGSSVTVLNMGSNDTVYWDIGTSATLGTETAFAGDLIAETSITLGTGSSMDCGSALALNGAVTLNANSVTSCGIANDASPDIATTPEPNSLLLLSTGVGGIFMCCRRRVRSARVSCGVGK